MREAFGFDQMQMIARIADLGNFSRAAAEMGVTQSAVSQQVRTIEEKLGRRLFRRGASGIGLTGDGEAYLVYARAMMKVGEDARRHFTRPRIRGAINLGLTEDFARTALPGVLSLFSREHPDFEFLVECGRSTKLFAGLDEGRYDAVVAKRPIGRRVGERLWTEPMVWYGRADTPRPAPDVVDLVVMPAPSETRDAILDALREADRAWRIVFQSTSVATMEAVIKAGVGLSAFGRFLDPAGLIELGPDAGLPPLGEVEFVMQQGRRSDTADVEAFCRVVREAALLVIKRNAGAGPN